MNFKTSGLMPELLDAVASRGYDKMTPIQEQAIPAVLKGKDVLGGAQTGTGKTAAFALPVLQILSENHTNKRHRAPRALVLTPTRELADQVGESFVDYGKFLNLRSAAIYGGVSINPQISAIRKGLDIVIATPGRLLDHLDQKTINLDQIEILILDEADRMLDMGFIRDIRRIQSFLPKKRQNLMFSATYDKEIRKLAESLLSNPVSVEVTRRNTAAEKVEQKVHHIDKTQKRHLLAHLIKTENWYQVLVFVRTKHGANRLAKQLLKADIPSAAIHGDKSQGARTRALNQFKQGDLQALIATDVAARGIHLEELSHVVNFDLPQVPEDYVHRIGRTGRAGKSGKAVSFVSPDEVKQIQRIERLLKTSIPEADVKGFVPVISDPVPGGHPQGSGHSRGSGHHQGAGRPRSERAQGGRNQGFGRPRSERAQGGAEYQGGTPRDGDARRSAGPRSDGRPRNPERVQGADRAQNPGRNRNGSRPQGAGRFTRSSSGSKPAGNNSFRRRKSS